MSRNTDPVIALEQRGQREAFERQRDFQVLRIADEIVRDSETEGFKHIFHILGEMLKRKKEEYGAVINAPVKEIVGRSEVYLLKRATLEAEVKQLESIIGLPDSYKKQAEAIRKTPSSETYRRKTKDAKEKL